jgi:hypothetical protein
MIRYGVLPWNLLIAHDSLLIIRRFLLNIVVFEALIQAEKPDVRGKNTNFAAFFRKFSVRMVIGKLDTELSIHY